MFKLKNNSICGHPVSDISCSGSMFKRVLIICHTIRSDCHIKQTFSNLCYSNFYKLHWCCDVWNGTTIVKWKYNVNMLKQNMLECNHVIRWSAKPPPNYVPHINILKELILVRDSSKSIDGFNYNEICEMIDDVSTFFYLVIIFFFF